MISFYKKENLLLLHYEPRDGVSWIKHRFEKLETIPLKKTFLLSSHNPFLDIIEQAVQLIISGEIVKYRYDGEKEEIMVR